MKYTHYTYSVNLLWVDPLNAIIQEIPDIDFSVSNLTVTELEPPAKQRILASPEQITAFCHQWKITEFALFGSVLRDDFHPNSDIDVLLTFVPEQWLTWDNWQAMQAEIETLFKRKVDLVSKKHLKNPYRRHEILNTRQVIYAA